jgi:hypothetical protein
MAASMAPELGSVLPSVADEAASAAHSLDWRTTYPPEAWKRIRAEGIYLACVLSFAVVVTAILLRVDLSKHQEVQKFLCCALGGIAGSWIFAMKWYVRAITKHIWHHDLIVWRVTAPFMGIFLSVSAYAVLQAGLIGITFEGNSSVDPRMYAYAVGFLVGLCSDVVMGKLTEVAETVFGKTTDRHIQRNKIPQ